MVEWQYEPRHDGEEMLMRLTGNVSIRTVGLAFLKQALVGIVMASCGR